jgi:hypothetical protein
MDLYSAAAMCNCGDAYGNNRYVVQRVRVLVLMHYEKLQNCSIFLVYLLLSREVCSPRKSDSDAVNHGAEADFKLSQSHAMIGEP